MRRIVADVWSDVFAFDTRFFRTLHPLFLRPGFLTVEFLAGRRARYMQPWKAYIFASVLFFGLVALRGGTVMTVYTDVSDPATATAINDFVNAVLTYVHFFLVPVFASIIMLLYRRSGRYYIEHLVFAFYFAAFAVLFMMIFAVVGLVLGGTAQGPQPPAVRVLAVLSGAVLFAYLVAALHRVYKSAWPGATLRAVAITILYTVAFIVISAAIILVAVGLYGGGVLSAPGAAA